MNGTIKYLKRKNLGNYEHEEAAAEISFGDGETADAAQAEAMYRVHDMLGLGDNGVAAAMAKAEALTKAPEVAPLPNPTPLVVAPVTPSSPVIAPTPAAAGPVPDTHGGVVPAEQIPVGIGQIAAMAKSRRKAAKAIDIGATPIAVETPLVVEAGSDEWTSEAATITNADLGRACSLKQEALGGVGAGKTKIQSLIGDFVGGPGKHLADIPQEDRQRFLAALAQLS